MANPGKLLRTFWSSVIAAHQGLLQGLHIHNRMQNNHWNTTILIPVPNLFHTHFLSSISLIVLYISIGSVKDQFPAMLENKWQEKKSGLNPCPLNRGRVSYASLLTLRKDIYWSPIPTDFTRRCSSPPPRALFLQKHTIVLLTMVFCFFRYVVFFQLSNIIAFNSTCFFIVCEWHKLVVSLTQYIDFKAIFWSDTSSPQTIKYLVQSDSKKILFNNRDVSNVLYDTSMQYINNIQSRVDTSSVRFFWSGLTG